MKLAQKLVINYFRAKLNMLSVISKRKAAESAFNLFCTPLRRPKKGLPAIFDKAEHLNFVLDDYSIYGYRWNTTPDPASLAERKKILVVHGFESSSKNFERYINSLIKKGYEVIAFDAPAHGMSSGKRINLPIYLATVKKIYELYGPINGFVAHSYGGLVVAHFLETLVHDNSVKAVLIAPATETTSTINSFFSFLQLNDGVRSEFDKLIFDRSGYWPDHFSIRRAMHHINANILWFHDEEDELTPVEDALKVEEDHHPNIQFRITKGLGHRRIYRDNAVVKEILEFL
jgi:pimeloyl-ACP methyl ester carboxylesterase